MMRSRVYNEKCAKALPRIMALCILFLLALASTGALADNQVSLKATPGFNGIYKLNSVVPIQVTVENKGKDLSGKLVVGTGKEHRTWGEASYSKEIYISAGETKQIELLVPGDAVIEAQVNLVVDDHLITWTPIEGLAVRGQGTLVLGISDRGNIHTPILAADQGQGNFRGILTGKTIMPKDLPADLLALQGIDILVLDEANRNNLTSDQQKALDKWVMAGGKLVIAKAPEASISGRVMAEVDGNPILFRESRGNGLIVYSNYDFLADSGLTQEEEQALWSDFVSREIYADIRYYGDSFWGGYWSYLDAANIFEDLTPPSFLTLGLLFVGYVIIIGPLVYLILKRIDRRDWSWVAIPLFALVAASVIIGIGNSRIDGEGIAQTVAEINIYDGDTALIKGGASLVIPRGGNYQLDADFDTFAIPAARGGMQRGNMAVMVNQSGERSIEFRHVEPWSVRNVLFNKWINDLGAVEGDLTLDNNELKGTLVNNTLLDLKDVVLGIGFYNIPVGDLKRGEAVELNRLLDWEELRGGTENFNRMIRGAAPGRVYMETVAAKPVRLAPNELEVGYVDKVNLTGWAQNDLELLTPTNLQVESKSTFQVNQIIELKLEHEESVFYPLGTIAPTYTNETDYVYYDHPVLRGIQLQGIVELEFPIGKHIQVERLTNNFYAEQFARVSRAIYNWQTGEWDDLSDSSLDVIDSYLAQYYLSEEGVMRVRFINETGGREAVPEPAIQVLGRVGND